MYLRWIIAKQNWEATEEQGWRDENIIRRKKSSPRNEHMLFPTTLCAPVCREHPGAPHWGHTAGFFWEKKQDDRQSLLPHGNERLAENWYHLEGGELWGVGGELCLLGTTSYLTGRQQSFASQGSWGNALKTTPLHFGTWNQLRNILWGLILENVYAQWWKHKV